MRIKGATGVLPKPYYSNCPLAVLYLWLRGRCNYVVATKSDTPIPFWPWHFGVMVSTESNAVVLHFKRTKDNQYWAPFYFEGKIKRSTLEVVKRGRFKVLWIKPAIKVIPFLVVLVLVGLPIWMLISAGYWPYWLILETIRAVSKTKRSVYDSRSYSCSGRTRSTMDGAR